MSETEKSIRFWHCDYCSFEWQAKCDRKPKQCPKCWRRNWDGGALTQSAQQAKPEADALRHQRSVGTPTVPCVVLTDTSSIGRSK